MKDLLVEIWESVRRNKLRTILTGASVSWGIFMLIVLLGAGNGLVNAFQAGSESYATNTMEIGGSRTTKPYAGYKSGRWISTEYSDIDLVKSGRFADIVDEVSGTLYVSDTVAYGKQSLRGTVTGCMPSIARMEKFDILDGRFINDNDFNGERKVVVLTEKEAGILFGTSEGVVGRYVRIGHSAFKVIGIQKADESMYGYDFYIPISTLRKIYNRGNRISYLTLSFHGLETEDANEEFETSLKRALNIRHDVAPDDDGAFWTWNRFVQNLQMQTAGNIINTALWIIGILTLLGGIVGVSNIMLITVRERTHEFGIRKALGATPWKIDKLIIGESIAITAIFGYIGMILGLVACDVLDKTVAQSSMDVMGEKIRTLVDPGIDVGTAVAATIVIIIAGTIAGLIPAVKAGKVKPIEALRAE